MNITIWVARLDCKAGAVQAICAVLGLVGLFSYCWLTLGIHQAAVRHANGSIRPYIGIDEMSERDDPDFRSAILPTEKQKVFIIRNLGNGPALDVQWTTGSQEDAKLDSNWNKLGDLAVGDWSHLPDAKAEFMFDRPTKGLTVRFSDVAENKYETTEECRDGVFYSKCRPRK